MKKYIVLTILVLILGGFAYCCTFTLKKVEVIGCDIVNEQAIVDAAESRDFANNTILLYFINKFKPNWDIPFVAKVEMEFTNKNTITFVVYEKQLAGCVQFGNQYLYIDNDGYVLEASDGYIQKVPTITGIDFEYYTQGEKLPVEDKSKFQTILTITQLIDKYDLLIEDIQFTEDNGIELMYKDILIELGSGEHLEVQMMNLGNILAGVEGMSGTLHMKEYTTENATATFSTN